MTRIAVVGGGISGLLASYRLQQRGHSVTLFEGQARPGGKIASGEVDGIGVEDGPDAFLPRDDAPLELLRELGITQTVSPAVFGAYIWHRGALRRLPPGSPYGIPRVPGDARRAGLLSAFGAARASLERFRRSPLMGPDVSIGSFVRSRFGAEVLDNLVDPLLAGVRGGTPDDISLAAAAREIDAVARNNPSVLRALKSIDPGQPRFIKPAQGLGAVTDALAARIDDLRTGARVERVESHHPSAWVVTASGDETFDGVVLACPPSSAAEIVRSLDADLARLLQQIEHASLAVICLVYPPASFVAPADGSGFLVPASSGLSISACTWYSHKWPDVTGDGRQVVRCVIGRAGDDPNLQLGDGDLAARAHADLTVTMGITTAPIAHRVARWDQAIPQYRVGHLGLVDEIDRRCARLGSLVVTGAGYRGSGIPDCITQAGAAATRMTELIGARAG